jgi:protein-tyrosine phosphatase
MRRGEVHGEASVLRTQARSGVTSFIDFHNHVLAGVDDGARDEATSHAAVEAFLDAGAECLIATPHFDASLAMQPERMQTRMAALDASWDALASWCAAVHPTLQLRRGVELKMDVPEPDCSDPRLRLGGGRFVLVEFPALSVPLHSEVPLHAVRAAGYVPVLAHPERYSGFDEELRLARRWKDVGAFLQVNAGSLTGRYGSRVRARAVQLLEAGLADYICSDYHARGDLATTVLLDDESQESEALTLLCRDNARRLLDDQEPLPVPPAERRAWWHTLARRLRLPGT